MTKDIKAKDIIKRAVENAKLDRGMAAIQVDDLSRALIENSDPLKHSQFGLTFAKYMETLQRSNDQLIKLADLTRKMEIIEAEEAEFDEDAFFEDLKKEA